jgi:nicotinamidase-related amidase
MAVSNEWLFGPLLRQRMEGNPAAQALLGTTIAPTMISGGVRPNVLPAEATAMINFRIHPRDDSAGLLRRARQADVPVVYANDNFGRWRSDLSAVVERCLESSCKGRPLAERLRPERDDYFVLKPKHSAFFATTMDTLLRYLGTRTVVVGGFSTDICVLFTANDAYMRDLKVIVPSDCVAAEDSPNNQTVLALMERVLKAEIRRASEINFRGD